MKTINALAAEARAIRDMQPIPQVPSDRLGAAGLVPLTVDLATFSAPRRVSQRLWGLVYLRRGSSAAGLVDVRTSAGVVTMRPGDSYRDTNAAGELELVPSTGAPSSGTARLVLLTTADADFREPSGDGTAADTAPGTCGPAGAVTQAAGALAGVNAPTAATDGYSAEGMTGLRVIISAAAGQTLSAPAGAYVRFWIYLSSLARWVPTESVVNLSFTPYAPGARDWASQDLPSLMPAPDRWYPEVVGQAASSGNLTVRGQRAGVVS